MLRWPSGVTAIRQLAVERPSRAGAVVKSTPISAMDWAKTLPSTSSNTLPTNRPRPPSEDSPARVLAAEPPAIS